MNHNTITPLIDLDAYVLLPFLDAKDIHFIILTNKNVPEEFKKALERFKYITFREIQYFEPYELSQIKYMLNVDLESANDKNMNTIQEFREKHDEEHIHKIKSMEMRTDVNGMKYIFVLHDDRVCKHIIYERKMRVIENELAIYCLERA